MKTVFLTADADNVRLDVFLSENLEEITRTAAARIISQGDVTVNGKNVLKSAKIQRSDEISVTLPDPVPDKNEPENIPLKIVYEDDDLCVVNKPKGMVVHPAAGNYTGTMVNALLFHCGESLSGIGGVMRPGIVHRIDKNTGGLLIVAKNDTAHIKLAEQIKEHSFTREYYAVVQGVLKDDNGKIEAPIGRHPVKRKQMAVTEKNSKPAVTEYFVEERFAHYTFVRLKLFTGRTHQIRVHMSYIGHPVAGDTVYGAKAQKGFEGQCLFAAKIGFIHPRTDEYKEFTAELPDYFKQFLEKIKKEQ